jgi:hypothetical protein
MENRRTELTPWASKLPARRQDHRRRRTGGLFATAFCTATLCSLPAGAQPTSDPSDDATAEARTSSLASVPDDATTYIFSVRPSAGFGVGNVGVAERAGVAAEYWISDHVGLGLAGTFISQDTILDKGPSASSRAIGPVIAYRGAPRFGYFIATMGAGYANVRRFETDGLFCIVRCSPDVLTYQSGFTANTSVGWLFHPWASQFEIGPVARLDALQTLAGSPRTDYVFTVNLELGFALLSPKRVQ